MMSRFLGYVEIKTKITSTFTFFMILAYIFFRHQKIDLLPTVVFFCSMFLFDLTTTAINNYIDTKSNGQALQFERKTALLIIFILFGVSTLLGLYLVYITADIVILLLGGLCFVCGILYTFGPLPISRMPLGEILSGIFYGLFIPFFMLYINMPEGTFLVYELGWDKVSATLMVWPIVTLLLLSVAPVCTTANIMLANNICDVEKDITVRRYTLPYYLGKRAIALFAGIYYLTYMAMIAMVILKILPVLCLLSLLTIFPVQKNINKFMKRQEKSDTFIVSIVNFILIMGTNTVLIFISALI